MQKNQVEAEAKLADGHSTADGDAVSKSDLRQMRRDARDQLAQSRRKQRTRSFSRCEIRSPNTRSH